MQKYKGKNAWWYIVFVIIFNILPIIFIFFFTYVVNVFFALILAFYYAFDILLIPSIFRNHIELYDDYFIFYYGLHKQTVKLSDIRIIRKSKDPMTSSANSLDRIYISTKQKDFMISLQNNDDFIKKIQSSFLIR